MKTAEGNSYRQILRSTSIIGGASGFTIVLGLVRTKAAAFFVGPAGVGLIGLFINLIATAASAAGLGLGNVGTRRIAEAAASEDPHELADVRRALFWATIALALAGLAVWSARVALARWLLSDAGRASQVGWLALGVVLLVAAASQTALLNGLRHIGDLARVSIWSSVLSGCVAVTAVWLWRDRGLVAFVIAAPCAAFALGMIYVARLPRVAAPTTRRAVLFREWNGLARLGTAFMLAGFAGMLAQLLVRGTVQRHLGVISLGQFQASWAISMTYTGFVLQAMTTDYYPRLSAARHDAEATNRMVNQQTEVALLLAAPVLLVTLGLAPWIIRVLYSSEFATAAAVLRWQVIGDVLRIASWPLGFAILAAGRGKTYLATELWSALILLVVTRLYVDSLGVAATGIAFVAMYAAYLPVVYVVARHRTGFAWTGAVAWQMASLVAAAAVVALACQWNNVAGGALGVTLALGFGALALARLAGMAGLTGPVGRAGAVSRRGLRLMGVWRE